MLSVKDEFFHRHIVQYNLLDPVFDLFRVYSASVGNNLLSSAILEVRSFMVRCNAFLMLHVTFGIWRTLSFCN